MVKTFIGQGDVDGKALTQSSRLRQLIIKGVISLSLFLLLSRKSQIQLGGQRLSIGSTHRDRIYYHFPSKARLGAGVAERYWQDTQSVLNDMRSANADPKECLRLYPWIFRKSLEDDNRLCLSSFMAAEVEDLPGEVLREVMAFADINVAWLAEVLKCAATVPQAECERRARAIYAAVAGAQLIARTRADISVFDDWIASYREAGLIPD
ncbi:TetR family transcriptional regulator [Pseudomonas syringae pv. delphinii]|uniref:TetR/AcrR family transcriptional regulator n=1 Tax=Pseudomonas syringae group genomosp. 3 TaxID=251701 RepID=UPI000B15414C|nr:TetR/AcrR family transcriptional regulator [Pseudomonas syringae group genomosp. 3]RMP21832.1 TetR family transcriptional regulator [Pseudomonas syringae pv. delphinii]